jgi:peptidyl-tRNA hydrolase, PTH1 family
MWLIAGLGNPGKDYEQTRHNVGFMVVDRLAARWKAGKPAAKFKGDFAQASIAGEPALLLKPTTFMNLSGQSVQACMAFYKVPLDRVLVVHDDLDLALGQVKIKRGGGAGGHNGLKSIDQSIGPEYIRVRGGVGHPGGRERVVGHVLSPFRGKEAEEAAILVEHLADAVEMILQDAGVLERAQGKYHALRPAKA